MIQSDRGLHLGFVAHRLPWFLAAAAFAIYLLTLNPWVSLQSLPVAAKVTGWDWSSTVPVPLLHLVTYPFRWLPASWQLPALNGFAALCAALTLALLARSVALLPHDRTREQRQRERSDFSLLSIPAAWVPPAVAVAVCGLELTFWEHATSLSGESLNLLLFAYVVRCLLEFRLDAREGWLYRMAFVYGLAATNNWAMVGFFPAALLAVVWIRGFEFFNVRFLARMAGLGLLGLSCYLFIPLIEVIDGSTTASFWELLRQQVGAQKALLLFPPLRNRALVCGLTSLLPVLVMGIRWPSSFGDISNVGSMLSNAMFKLIHGVFLVGCAWVVFDEAFSPRHLGLGLPFLTFYYLGALSIGYFTGYFLLVSGQEPRRTGFRASALTRLLNRVVFGVVCLGAIAIPGALACRNLPLIRFTNAPALRAFASNLVDPVPASETLLLSEETAGLLLAEAAHRQRNPAQAQLLVNTQMLPYPAYQRALKRRYKERWPLPPNLETNTPLDSVTLLQQVYLLGQTNAIFYLQPSFGYFFEHYFLEPESAIYRFNAFPEGLIDVPPLSPQRIQAQETYWDKVRASMPAILRGKRAKIPDAEFLARHYSRGLDHWGVQLQRNQRLDLAQKSFEDAALWSEDNIAALVNSQFNENLRSGTGASVQIDSRVEDKLKAYPNWSTFVRVCGPVDEPSFCLNLGRVFAEGSLYRQAAQQFTRALALKPDAMETWFLLADTYLKGQRPDKTLELIKELRAQPRYRGFGTDTVLAISRLEAWAYYHRNDAARAQTLLEELLAKHPAAEDTLFTLAQMHLQSSRYTNALELLDRQLGATPQNIKAMLNKSAVLIQMKAYDRAKALLGAVLSLEPQNRGALMNRGIANFQLGLWDEARDDYEALLKVIPDYTAAYYRLAEIARHRNQAREEIENYRLFLKYAPEGTPEIREAEKRLAELKASR
jgi:tetratricopeptide (TPR) repeat protein